MIDRLGRTIVGIESQLVLLLLFLKRFGNDVGHLTPLVHLLKGVLDRLRHLYLVVQVLLTMRVTLLHVLLALLLIKILKLLY